MARFVAKPFYTIRDLVNLLNEFEKTRPADQRISWNRKRLRTLLRQFGLEPHGAGERFKAVVTHVQLEGLAPDLVRSMVVLDEYEDAEAA
jgi:hypothetical protein